VDLQSLQDSGVKTENAPYLGDISTEDGKMIQLIRVDELLTDSVREIIFLDTEA
jgi:chemotaxis signal transduction protein